MDKILQTLLNQEARTSYLLGGDAVYHAYDTIIVLSIDEKNKQMKLINFPRDAYRL